ncbi:MAG: antibiotic biosynthesis monooxygenase family protein [Bowdeniella nasicola]|nr:antibiotic biosynthesis monooxygenase family protein [Bowdeniella nasicola]
MSIIVTNEITVEPARADEVARQFAENAAGIKQFEGFCGFQLCRPTDPADDRWLVITHWDSEESYNAWRTSKNYSRSHADDTPEEKAERAENHRKAASVVRHYDVAFNTEEC